MSASGCADDLPELNYSPNKKDRLIGLVKGYFHQLQEGCGSSGCDNQHCHSSSKFEHGDLDATGLYDKAKELSRAGFREPDPVYYFCARYCHALPAVSCRIASATFLKGKNVNELDSEFFMSTLGCVKSACWFLYCPKQMRLGKDVYSDQKMLPLPQLPFLNLTDGCFGLDLPSIRQFFQEVSENEHFQKAITQLAQEMRVNSLITPREGTDDDNEKISEWKDVLKSEYDFLSCENSMQKIDKNRYLNNFLTLRLVRLTAILLECPFVQNTIPVLSDLCTFIGRLHHYLSGPLIGLYSQYNPEDLTRIVQSFQTFITLTLMQEETLFREDVRFHTYMPGGCIVLSILCEANFCLQAEGIIPYIEFYNDGINENMNAKVDFESCYLNDTASHLLGQKEEKKMVLRTVRDVFLNVSTSWRKENPSGMSKKFAVSQYPFLLNAAFKHSLLRHHSSWLQECEARRSIYLNTVHSAEDLYLVLKVDRHDLINTTLRALNLQREKLRRHLRVVFQNEEGIDEGGVKKEFFQLVVRQLVDPSYGMFTEDKETNYHWFQPRIICSTNDLEFHLIGKIFGLALYNQVILDINFPIVAYKKLLYIDPQFDDLKTWDPVLYKSLKALLEFDEEENGVSVQDTFCRNFSVAHDVFGESVEVELKPGGKEIEVTKDNRQEYVELYTKYVCSDSIGKNFEEFRNGFYQVCGMQAELLKTFHPQELEKMVVGSPDFDLAELEHSTRYDGYTPDSQVIKNFWEIINEMTMEEQRTFLKFCTGTDRLPIRGLRSLCFVIGKNGDDPEKLPTAHTCFNHLLFPEYPTKEKLKEKLFLAIKNCLGFGLL